MQSGLYLRIPPRFVLGAWCALALPAMAYAQTAGTVTKVSGSAYVVKPPSGPFEKETRIAVKAGAAVRWDDTLLTGPAARIRLQLNDGSMLSLGRQSRLKVNKHDAKTQQSDFELVGRVRANVVHLAQPASHFDILTNSCVIGVLAGGDIAVDADNPSATVVLSRTGQTVMDCTKSGQRMRLQIPAGFYASSSEGTLHPLTADLLGPVYLGFTLSIQRSDNFEISKSRKEYMGATDQFRHPLTTQVVPISRGRYVL
jgi:hypothetical protein